ncbi:MAG: adaptor protein MecA [Butyrivibrio sp.]|nr:adaptor protein MecA [Butyrivibrio sp.]
MEFKRINKHTVTCKITEDDMFEQGIKLEDLFEKKKEAMDFLHEVMKKAEEEVDYKPNGSFTPLQITVLPDHSISLLLSEDSSSSFAQMLKNVSEKAGLHIPQDVLEDIGDSIEEDRIKHLNEYLKSLKDLTTSVKNIMDENGIKNESSLVSVNDNATSDKAKEKIGKIATPAHKKEDENKSKEADQKRLKLHEYIFSFGDINTVIEFCSKAPKNIKIESALFKNSGDGRYYMDLMRCDEDPKVFASLFTMAYEFGHFQASNLNAIAFIKENYDCLIKENAIGQLSDIYG